MIKLILDINEPGELQKTSLHENLSVYINGLIRHNFDELISMLYRIDVSEQKLKTILTENSSGDAGDIIATLIIERQLQKIKSRQANRRDNDINEAEGW